MLQLQYPDSINCQFYRANGYFGPMGCLEHTQNGGGRASKGKLLQIGKWSGRGDSNARPQPWQGCALPLSYARSLDVAGNPAPGKAMRLGPGGEAGS